MRHSGEKTKDYENALDAFHEGGYEKVQHVFMRYRQRGIDFQGLQPDNPYAQTRRVDPRVFLSEICGIPASVQLRALHEGYHAFGGSFVTYLFDAYGKADRFNRLRLRLMFPDYYIQYVTMGYPRVKG